MANNLNIIFIEYSQSYKGFVYLQPIYNFLQIIENIECNFKKFEYFNL